MSEYVSYRSTVMDGGSGEAVRERLRHWGVFYHDRQAWATAGQRAEELVKRMEDEMDRHYCTSLAGDGLQQEINRLAAMLKAFEGVDTFRVFTETLHESELNAIRHSLNDLRHQAEKADSCERMVEQTIRAQNRLARLAIRVQKSLCGVEKEVLLETVGASWRHWVTVLYSTAVH